MTIDELTRAANALLDANPDGLTGDDVDTYNRYLGQIETIQRREAIRHSVESGEATLRSGSIEDDPAPVPNHRDRIGDPFDGGSRFEGESQTRARAEAAIERAFDGDAAESAATVLRSIPGSDIADHITLTSSPAYRGAFARFMRDPEGFRDTMSTAERAAWGAVREYNRAALQLSGAVVPSPLDPSIVLTSAGTQDPMRSVARVEQTTSSSKRFVTSAGVSASFDGELTEVSDDTPSLAEVTVTAHRAQAFVQATIDAAQDQPNWDAEVARLFADAKATLEGTKFINGAGDGSNEPKGIWTALDGGSSELSPATPETFAAADVYEVIESLPVRFRQNAKWQLELSTLNAIHRFYNPAGSEPALLEGANILRRPYVENSNISPYSGINAAATADNAILFLGDWRNYVILDRVGLSIEPVGLLLNTANNLPDGRKGWFAHWRVGADVLSAGAFRVMNIATAE